MHPVERVRDIDDPVLLADRRDRLCKRHPAWNLLVEEQSDHLALVVGLHLLARNHDQLAAPGQLDGFEGPAEDVVVGHRDRPEPFLLGVVDQPLRLDRAVVRPLRVHVEVDDDPVASPEWVAVGVRPSRGRVAPTVGHGCVDALQPLGDPVEARRLCLCPRFGAGTQPQPVVLGEPRNRGGRELGLIHQSCRVGDRTARGLRLEQEARAAARRRHEDGRFGQRGTARLGLHQ